MAETSVTFDAVEVVRSTLFGMMCRIDGRNVFVGSALPLSGTTIRVAGNIGRLVLPGWFVIQEGLATPERSPN